MTLANGGFIGAMKSPLSTGPAGLWTPEDFARAKFNDRDLIASEAPEYPQDALWSSTVANLHFNGPVGECVYINTALANTSSGGGVFTARSGNPVLANTTVKFGKTSLATGSGVVAATNSSFSWGTGDATVEGWSYQNANATADLFDQRQAEPTTMPLMFVTNTGVVTLHVAGADKITSSTGVWTAATWHHWAWCRASGTSRLFVDGVQVGSNFTDANNYSATSFIYIHAGFNASSGMSGFCGAFRATRAARYTTTYSVPTLPFPDY